MSDRVAFSTGSGGHKIVAELQSVVALLTQIEDNTDSPGILGDTTNISNQISDMNQNTLEEIKTKLDTINTSLANLLSGVAVDIDSLDTKASTRNTLITSTNTLITASNALLTTIDAFLSAIVGNQTDGDQKTQMIDSVGTAQYGFSAQITSDTPNSDGRAIATNHARIMGFNHLFNGTTWDRIRNETGHSSGAGLQVFPSISGVAQYGLSAQATVDANSVLAVRLFDGAGLGLATDANRNLRVNFTDSSGNAQYGSELQTKVATAWNNDTYPVSSINAMYTIAYNMAFDGTNAVRLRADASKNLKVTRDTPRYTVNLDKEALSASESFILIDLSDSTNFPHTEISFIKIYQIIINLNGDTSFRGDLEIGFIEEVDATDATTHNLLTIHHDQQSDDHSQVIKFDDPLKLAVSNHLTNNKNTTNTNFQTDVSLDSPYGDTSSPAGPGDMYLQFTRTAGTADISITVIYDTE